MIVKEVWDASPKTDKEFTEFLIEKIKNNNSDKITEEQKQFIINHYEKNGVDDLIDNIDHISPYIIEFFDTKLIINTTHFNKDGDIFQCYINGDHVSDHKKRKDAEEAGLIYMIKQNEETSTL